MKKINKKIFIGVGFLASFVIWTLLIIFVDVRAIGPNGSSVGFAALNGFFHSLTGANMTLYTITDWLGLVPIGVAFAFAVFGLVQWIKRKSFIKVDRDILVLGAFYIAVMSVYALFEFVVVNYRPVLIYGYLEASYPSSTTMLVACVMPATIMQLAARIKNKTLRYIAVTVISAFIAFMVIGRLVSGVHWITDLIGGALVSVGLVILYDAFSGLSYCEKEK